MACLLKRPLLGLFVTPSKFFLENNGFYNVEHVSHLSVWINTKLGITLYLPQDTVVTEYDVLSKLIYDRGYNHGFFKGSEKVKYHIKDKLDTLIFDFNRFDYE